MARINRKESAALINSLSAGVVPRIGLRHIAVGREKEVSSFLHDLETIQDDGAACRFISGKYGSGKTFLLQLIRNNALDRGFVVMDADLSPERRLTGTKQQGLATYRELLQNLSTRARPDGSGLESVLQKWISTLQREAASENGLTASSPEIVPLVSEKIAESLKPMSEMAYGFAFAEVLEAYWHGIKEDNDELKQYALKWLRGEYTTKTEAKKDLPVDRIIDDQNWYDFLKLFARFVRMAGYQGLVVFLDECVNLYKIPHGVSRKSNYEKILTIFNDTRQGKASGIGFFFSGTPDFITDERRGLYSYEALKSRLMDNRFATDKLVDYNAPVLNIPMLTNEEMYLLLERLTEVHEANFNYDAGMTMEKLTQFLQQEMSRIGADTRMTPREMTRDFLGLLNILQQNPDQSFESLLKSQNNSEFIPLGSDDSENEDIFASFSL